MWAPLLLLCRHSRTEPYSSPTRKLAAIDDNVTGMKKNIYVSFCFAVSVSGTNKPAQPPQPAPHDRIMDIIICPASEASCEPREFIVADELLHCCYLVTRTACAAWNISILTFSLQSAHLQPFPAVPRRSGEEGMRSWSWQM